MGCFNRSWVVESMTDPEQGGGWGGRIRTYAYQGQNLVPYRLATPQ